MQILFLRAFSNIVQCKNRQAVHRKEKPVGLKEKISLGFTLHIQKTEI